MKMSSSGFGELVLLVHLSPQYSNHLSPGNFRAICVPSFALKDSKVAP